MHRFTNTKYSKLDDSPICTTAKTSTNTYIRKSVGYHITLIRFKNNANIYFPPPCTFPV